MRTPHSALRTAPAPRFVRRAAGERGIAMIVALLSMMLLTALGMSLMLTSHTETLITGNYKDSVEGLYAADAAVERVMQDVLTVPDWNTLLTSPDGVRATVTSGFIDDTTAPTLGDGRVLNLSTATHMANCGRTSACTVSQMDTSTADRPWGVNNPRWHLYAWGPVNDLVPTGTLNSPFYVAVWIADDSAESDADPTKDGGAPVAPFDPNGLNNGRGVLALRAEAFGPGGGHRVIETTVAKTDNTEIERGYTGQRGQDEQNRRARKAAIQTPGAGLTRSEMTLGGGLTTQAW